MNSHYLSIYPQFKTEYSKGEVLEITTITQEEYFSCKERLKQNQLLYFLLLKVQQYLFYIPSLEDIPSIFIEEVIIQLQFDKTENYQEQLSNISKRTLREVKKNIRVYTNTTLYAENGGELIKELLFDISYRMSDPKDLLNACIKQLITHKILLPKPGTLIRLVKQIRHKVQLSIYQNLFHQLSLEQKKTLDELLLKVDDDLKTTFSSFKEPPQTLTITHVKKWIERYKNLVSLIDTKSLLSNITFTKIKQFYAEAYASEVSELKNMNNDRRYTLLICFLHIIKAETLDDLLLMFIKRIRTNINQAKEILDKYKIEHRKNEEGLAKIQLKMFEISVATIGNSNELYKQLHALYNEYGGLDDLKEKSQFLTQFHEDNYFPFIYKFYKNYRTSILQIIEFGQLYSVNPNDELISDWKQYQSVVYVKSKTISGVVFNLNYASKKWQQVIIKKEQDQILYDKHLLEICLVYYLSNGLESFDFYAKDSFEYANAEEYLIPYKEFEKEKSSYTLQLNLPENSLPFITHLKEQLDDKIIDFDSKFKGFEHLSINENGRISLSKTKISKKNKELDLFKELIKSKMPPQSLLDIMHRVNHFCGYTNNFHHITESKAKSPNSLLNYLYTIFAYGVNIGPSYMERHTNHPITRRIISKLNRQHITPEKIQEAMSDVVNFFTSFEVTEKWGNKSAVVADGTHIELLENNLRGERHIRYGGYGGIAYHHISDTYIALFSQFIICGVWEAVYILDGLIRDKSNLQPNKIHADTQGQNATTFGLSYLLGIELLPRIRNAKDLILYKSTNHLQLEHVHDLFSKTIDWNLIEGYYDEMLRIAISIHKGKVLPSIILKKLGSKGKQTKIYKAFRELGRVQRTLFLIDYLSEVDLQRTITTATVKIESFNSFCDWITFGGERINSGDPLEQEKRVKYTTLLANIIMAHNTVDITRIIQQLKKEGIVVTDEMLEGLSPYMREHIRIYGEFVLNLDNIPNFNPVKNLS